MTFDPTKHEDMEEREEAIEAKEEADPAVNDPAFMPNIEPQKGPNSEEAD
jgi:hypothetical protein